MFVVNDFRDKLQAPVTPGLPNCAQFFRNIAPTRTKRRKAVLFQRTPCLEREVEQGASRPFLCADETNINHTALVRSK